MGGAGMLTGPPVALQGGEVPDPPRRFARGSG